MDKQMQHNINIQSIKNKVLKSYKKLKKLQKLSKFVSSAKMANVDTNISFWVNTMLLCDTPV